MERAIEQELDEAGIVDTSVSCPVDRNYGDGDFVICAVEDVDGGQTEVYLKMLNDGYYEWEYHP